MRKKSEAHEAFSLLLARDGIPQGIVMDGAKEQTMGDFRRKAKEVDCRVLQTEPYSPWQNAAEAAIRETKRGCGRKMLQTGSPLSLWDHCLELEALVRSNTALDIYELQGEVPETLVSGQTSDISPFSEYGWYDWVYYYEPVAQYPELKKQLGRWLGPAIDIGPAMTSKVLKQNGYYIHVSTVVKLTEDELNEESCIAARKTFDDAIAAKLGAQMTEDKLKELDPEALTPAFEPYEDDVDGIVPSIRDIDEVTPEEFDNYVGARVMLQIGGQQRAAHVKRRARNAHGELVGTQNSNPILDTRTYVVELDDGELSEVSANVIAENVYAQADAKGNHYVLMKDIVGYKMGTKAVQKGDEFITVNGRQHRRKTTAGWSLCIEWKDGTTSWERLADMKESFPVEVAEYAVAQGIDDMPAFWYWVPSTLKKRDRIIAAVKKRYHKIHEKFGIELPKTVRRALEIDEENGNHLWRDAIQKEMSVVKIAFKIIEEGPDGQVKIPDFHQYMDCHMVFDIKLDGFRRKARLVAGGHVTEQPAVMTYASVVTRETVRIALTLAALNDLEVKASDVQNAYLQAPVEELIYTKLGPEFEADEGKFAVITRALYGLKSAGASFGRHIADCMRTLGYTSCKADPDLWMKRSKRPDDGVEYYSYVLLYVDDVLAISHNATAVLNELDKFFMMKPGSIGDPDIYLGAKVKPITLNNGVVAWGMSSSKYVQDAVRNVEKYMQQHYPGRSLRRNATAPFPREYAPEQDISPELSPEKANYYQSQIGILHWIVELGRVDMITEVSMLASHMALPREGHLDAVFHVFAHLKNRHNARLVLDPTYPEIDTSIYQYHDWESTYGKLTEPIPSDMPTPLGKEVDLRLKVDADFAGDKVTRRSRTGYFIFMNSALIAWLSKRQATIETSVFGAEFVAMKQGLEAIRGIRYKLRMMGVPLSGPAYVQGDNMSVIHNTQRPDSQLKKKSNQVCYHYCRESVAMGESIMGHIGTHDNPADIATKVLYGGTKREHLVSMLLHDIHDGHD